MERPIGNGTASAKVYIDLLLHEGRGPRIMRSRVKVEMDGVTTPSVTEDNGMFMAMEQELLPGLPNFITLAHIATKVDWESIMVLSNVNHTWTQAVQDRLIHNARVRHHSIETFDVKYCSPPILAICRRGDHPSGRPYLRGPWETQIVVLDGRVYSLGLWIDFLNVKRNDLLRYASAEVYVLDLAGCSKHWVRCAPMQAATFDFVCGVKNGQMHVVGGWNGDTHVNTEEVYDPNKNAWSSKPIANDWLRGFLFQYSVDI